MAAQARIESDDCLATAPQLPDVTAAAFITSSGNGPTKTDVGVHDVAVVMFDWVSLRNVDGARKLGELSYPKAAADGLQLVAGSVTTWRRQEAAIRPDALSV
ncbi:MAG: hypothetical protein ABI702_19615 [Burkholderiales bacterium]